MDLAHDGRDIPSALTTAHLQFPSLRIADIIEVDTVDVITACDLLAHPGDIVARLGILRIHIAFVTDLLDKVRQLLTDLLATVAVPFPYGNGDHPGVTLHTALMTFVDAELQRIVAWRLSACARHTDIPGLDGRGIDGRCPDASLDQYGVDIGLLQLVEDADELLLLLVGRARAWPVEVLDSREPYGSHFVFRRLC